MVAPHVFPLIGAAPTTKFAVPEKLLFAGGPPEQQGGRNNTEGVFFTGIFSSTAALFNSDSGKISIEEILLVSDCPETWIEIKRHKTKKQLITTKSGFTTFFTD